jgi:hypothetical protein
MATLSQAANLLYSSLETATREDGSPFLRLSPLAPSWGQDAIRAAHLGELPNDSRYQLINECLSALSDGAFDSDEEANEAVAEIALDLAPDCTGELLAWFSDWAARLGDCDQALEDGRASGDSVLDILSAGYWLSAEESLYSLISSLEEQRASIFNPDTDCQLLLGDGLGVYIPQTYCQGISKSEAKDLDLDWWAVETCQHGPDGEFYWEAWQSILDSALWREDGCYWTLHQSGDLWAVKEGVEIPEGF